MALRLTQALYTFVLVFITAMLCRYFTSLGIDSFYGTLELPAMTPENHYFSYAWTVIYVLLFISFYITLESQKTEEQFYDANALFVTQLFLQILWTFSFFYLEQLWASAAVIVLLDMVVALLMHTLLFINGWAFVLMLPYLLWLLFATYLNVMLVFLN
ncbi:MAG: tryptophan-rich sensory protein [Alphaproteobacteria bacterium]|nr:tryptophan-rich sensory protein [Alphaproteobacteria bacterium]